MCHSFWRCLKMSRLKGRCNTWIAVGRCGCDAADVFDAAGAGGWQHVLSQEETAQPIDAWFLAPQWWTCLVAQHGFAIFRIFNSGDGWKMLKNNHFPNGTRLGLRLAETSSIFGFVFVVRCRHLSSRDCQICLLLMLSELVVSSWNPCETVKKPHVVVKCCEMLKNMLWNVEKHVQSCCQSLLVSSCRIRGMAGAIHRSLQRRTDLLQERPLPPSISPWNPLESLGIPWNPLETDESININ